MKVAVPTPSDHCAGCPPHWLGRLILKVCGWELVGKRPPQPKMVIILEPHTSGWDLPLWLAASWALGVKASWMGKHTLFGWPFGRLLRWLGGIPIDRRSQHDTVRQVAREFELVDGLYLGMSPSGTRRWTRSWRSGFYHIARQAKVPIGLGFIDYATQRLGLGAVLEPSGDPKTDMDRVRAFYSGLKGKHPGRQGPIRLESETAGV